MGFFDELTFPGWEDDSQDDLAFDQPEWFGSPRGWLGGVVPLEVAVARSAKAAVFLTRFVAYPTGFSMTANALARSPGEIPTASIRSN
jgi:hypothetical protein